MHPVRLATTTWTPELVGTTAVTACSSSSSTAAAAVRTTLLTRRRVGLQHAGCYTRPCIMLVAQFEFSIVLQGRWQRPGHLVGY
jgi:hypothetical protein